MNEVNEKCGVFGIFGKGLDVSRLAFYGLFALQHRGQESSGIATADGREIRSHKSMGLVNQAYSEEVIEKLTGHIAIGHNRYSTHLGTGLTHAQPRVIGQKLALAHNGNLPSVTVLLNFLQDNKVAIEGLNDSELMAEAVAYYMREGQNMPQAVKSAYPLFTGAFSLVIMSQNELVAVRDECGIRPLAMGKLNGGYVFASETCAFHTIGAEFLREVNPGEMVVVSDSGVVSEQIVPANPKLDIFEFVYFARPDSELMGKSVYEVRRRCGVRLAEERKINADIVVPVPETAIPVAVGYAAASGIPLEMALVKNRYIHRTFIQPEQHSRDLGVNLKLTPLPGVLRGKRVIVIDDSIVRGTTSCQLVQALYGAGASEVHFVVSSPPGRIPDFYGIDTPKQEALIAAMKTTEEIRDFFKATSLQYLSLKGLLDAVGLPPELLNTSCFTGDYPLDLRERFSEIHAPRVPLTEPLVCPWHAHE